MQFHNANPLVDSWTREASRDVLSKEMAQRLPAIFGSELQTPIFNDRENPVAALAGLSSCIRSILSLLCEAETNKGARSTIVRSAWY